jgi:hypothetical protein
MNRRRSLAQRRLSIASAAYCSDETYLIKRGWDISMPRRVHRVECVCLAYAAMDVCRRHPEGRRVFQALQRPRHEEHSSAPFLHMPQ